MDRIVYVLGAGFSAPIGIPVVRTFLEKSKDLFSENPNKYARFAKVFQQIKELSICKNYFKTDLFNIEDILSLLEMRATLAGQSQVRDDFMQYIRDVMQVLRGIDPFPPA
jgi:hypothetical protein